MTEHDIRLYLDRMAAAYNAGDAEGCATLFALNAQLHSPFAPPAIGRAAILELHREWVAAPSNKRFDLIDHGCDGDTAWCLCTFVDGGAAESGTSQLIFERQTDGAWLARSCCLFGQS
ncbi:MAG: nuclear transport factor 2 family protein [Pseudomonadota bacterium]